MRAARRKRSEALPRNRSGLIGGGNLVAEDRIELPTNEL